MSPLGQPPLPPSVTAQQAPPLTQFAQGGGGQQAPGSGGAAQPQGSAMELVTALVTEITSKLESVAKILAQEKPQLLPILKPAVQSLLMIQNEAGQKQGGPGGMAGGGPQGASPGGLSQQPQGAGAGVSAG